MQYKGPEKAAKVVEFVAKWLNLCLSTVYIWGDHTSIGFTHLTNLTFSESISFFSEITRISLNPVALGVDLTRSLNRVINSGAWEQIQLCWRAKDLFLKLIF